jgi:hypothetical protein
MNEMNQNLCALRVMCRGSVELSDMMAGSYAKHFLKVIWCPGNPN